MAIPANFVTRAKWGSTFNYTSNTRMPATCKGVALHWEGGGLGTFPHSECDNKVRSIETYHTKTKGWAGIAYNALVCPHGYIFEGRGTKYRSAANGDTAKNNAWFAVCYLGGTGDTFTTEAKAAYIRAVQWLRAEGGAGRSVIGHRDVTATECPGAVIEAWLKAANFDGATSASQPQQGADMALTDADITKIWETKNIPGPYKTKSFPDGRWTARAIIGTTVIRAGEAAADAAAALALVKVLAEKGTSLTAADIEAAVKAGIDAKIDTATVNLTTN